MRRNVDHYTANQPWKPAASSVGAKQRPAWTCEQPRLGWERVPCYVESHARESVGETPEELEDARVSDLSRSVPNAPRVGPARPGGTADCYGRRELRELGCMVAKRSKQGKKGKKSHHFYWLETHSEKQSAKAEEEEGLLQSL